MQAPTEQRVQPKEKTYLSSKGGPVFDKFHFLSSSSSFLDRRIKPNNKTN